MNTVRTGLHERLRRTQQLMRRGRAEQRHASGPLGDTTRGQGRVLAALKMQSPIPTRELAYLLDIRQQSLNEVLKRLEADGLVERTPSQEDRRVVIVSLTDAGREVKVAGEQTSYLSSLTDEEAATLSGLLDKIISSLETELGVSADEDLSWHAEARRRMGDEHFEAMLRMREQGFAPHEHHGHGRPGGRGHEGERPRRPWSEHQDAPEGERGSRRGRGGPAEHGDHHDHHDRDGHGEHGRPGGGGRHSGPRRGEFGPGVPGGEIPEHEVREFRRGPRGPRVERTWGEDDLRGRGPGGRSGLGGSGSSHRGRR